MCGGSGLWSKEPGFLRSIVTKLDHMPADFLSADTFVSMWYLLVLKGGLLGVPKCLCWLSI